MSRYTLQWCHNEHDGVSDHRRLDCLLNPLFRRRSTKSSKLRVTCLFEGDSPAAGEFPAQRASNTENVSLRWRHYEKILVIGCWACLNTQLSDLFFFSVKTLSVSPSMGFQLSPAPHECCHCWERWSRALWRHVSTLSYIGCFILIYRSISRATVGFELWPAADQSRTYIATWQRNTTWEFVWCFYDPDDVVRGCHVHFEAIISNMRRSN